MKTTGSSVVVLAILVSPGELPVVMELLEGSRPGISRIARGWRMVEDDEPIRPPTRIGELSIDIPARIVEVSGRRIELRRMEFDLLAHLAGDPERVFTKRDLLRHVWGYQAEGMTRTVDTHASRLRRKLSTGNAARWVVNVRGVGYRLI